MQMSFFAPTRTHDGVALRSSYHVRGKVQGPAAEVAAEVKSGERKARQQEEAILAFYRANPGAWGPSQVWHMTTYREPFMGWPITSVRRGITNLTTRGDLRMTNQRRESQWGAMEHLWELTEKGKA